MYAEAALLPFAVNYLPVETCADRKELLNLLPGQRYAIRELSAMDYRLDHRINWPIHRFHNLKMAYVKFMALPGLYQEPDKVQGIVDKIRARSEIPDLQVDVHHSGMDGRGGI